MRITIPFYYATVSHVFKKLLNTFFSSIAFLGVTSSSFLLLPFYLKHSCQESIRNEKRNMKTEHLNTTHVVLTEFIRTKQVINLFINVDIPIQSHKESYCIQNLKELQFSTFSFREIVKNLDFKTCFRENLWRLMCIIIGK